MENISPTKRKLISGFILSIFITAFYSTVASHEIFPFAPYTMYSWKFSKDSRWILFYAKDIYGQRHQAVNFGAVNEAVIANVMSDQLGRGESDEKLQQTLEHFLNTCKRVEKRKLCRFMSQDDFNFYPGVEFEALLMKPKLDSMGNVIPNGTEVDRVLGKFVEEDYPVAKRNQQME